VPDPTPGERGFAADMETLDLALEVFEAGSCPEFIVGKLEDATAEPA
jgi:hypothetical protein